MDRRYFETDTGQRIPSVSEDEMREVDRIAVEDFNLGILQMMENAGRNLALTAMEMISSPSDNIVVLAGSGGNGGGGICSLRHLLNHSIHPNLILTQPIESMRGAAKHQLSILLAAGFSPTFDAYEETIHSADLIIDTLLGYGLKGAPRGTSKELIAMIGESNKRILSLDIPSGVEATTGQAPGLRVRSTTTLTLALPKTGLYSIPGNLICADIGIPLEVYTKLGIHVDPFFEGRYRVPITPI